MARSLSVALGTVSVYLVYYICLKLWDYRSAEKAAWITTFFPTLILYSSVSSPVQSMPPAKRADYIKVKNLDTLKPEKVFEKLKKIKDIK